MTSRKGYWENVCDAFNYLHFWLLWISVCPSETWCELHVVEFSSIESTLALKGRRQRERLRHISFSPWLHPSLPLSLSELFPKKASPSVHPIFTRSAPMSGERYVCVCAHFKVCVLSSFLQLSPAYLKSNVSSEKAVKSRQIAITLCCNSTKL